MLLCTVQAQEEGTERDGQGGDEDDASAASGGD